MILLELQTDTNANPLRRDSPLQVTSTAIYQVLLKMSTSSASTIKDDKNMKYLWEQCATRRSCSFSYRFSVVTSSEKVVFVDVTFNSQLHSLFVFLTVQTKYFHMSFFYITTPSSLKAVMQKTGIWKDVEMWSFPVQAYSMIFQLGLYLTNRGKG